MILTVTLNPGIDKTYFIDQFIAEGRVNVRSVRQIAGGKGNNVARVIKNLGEDVLALNILGGHTGRIVLDLLASDGIPTEVVWAGGVTRSFITVVDANYHQVVYFEPHAEVTPADVEKTRQRFYELLPRVDMLCLCGSSPSPLLDPLYGEFIAAARRRGLYTLLDSSGEALGLGLKGAPYLVKCNLKEAEQLLGWSLAGEGGCLEAIRYCQEQGAEFVVLSLGAEGALVGVGKRRWRAIPPPVKAINPVGSGDAMMACLAVGLLQGQSFEEMIRLAVGAGVANAVMWDAASCTAEDIARYSLDVRTEEYNI